MDLLSTFYAHSTEKSDKSDWQSLQSHLENVAALAEGYAASFGAGAAARVAGLLHDLGKYTNEFQLRLSGQFGRMDHATWGARVAVERYAPVGRLLAYGIAGHHAGLANGSNGEARTALQERLKSDAKSALTGDWERELCLPAPSDLKLPERFEMRKERLSFQQAMLGRMIFSCLVDADFIDTEAFYLKAAGKDSARAGRPPALAALRERLETKLASFKPDSPLNVLRAEILTNVRARAVEPAGVFSLTVPTGGGKTLASLAFALDHAIWHGLRRVIFVIPFTSIVEQNAAVFREALGDLGEEAVLEHHSAFQENKREAKEAREKLHLAMENWDAPIVVTTAVQFFESLFADRSSRCRKLHNIAGSVVILDEAQTLPLKLLRPCVAALDELVLNYRTSVVLCTATQPALSAAQGFRGGFENVRELAPAPERLYRELKRVKVRHAGGLSDNQLAAIMLAKQQALCIVNNRRHARALHQAIRKEPGAWHLSTLMCAQHRSEVLREIRKLLKEGKPCRVVSTSLIEAGVDVDFPAVLRAEAGVDSIAQAAGRCNREGRRPVDESEVVVFAVENDEYAPPPELKQFAQVFREVHRQHSGDPLSLEAIHEYFRALYWQRGDDELDAHNLLGLLQGSRVASLPFETLAAKFRVIETVQFPVIVPYDKEAKDALKELAYVESPGGVARRLQRYIVQVPPWGYDALRKVGAIQPVLRERYEEQFMQLVNPDLYDKQFGLHWDDPAFIRAENLCW